MSIQEHIILLENAGFSLAGPDTWGKVTGEFTAFVEVSAESVSAFMYAPGTEEMLGPMLRIKGAPERAVPEALFQLEALMAQEDAQGDVVRSAPEDIQDEPIAA